MAAVFAGMLLSYAFHFFMVRALSPELYGDLSLIIGLISIILVPTGTLQILFTREISKLDKKGIEVREFLQHYLKLMAVFGAASAVLVFLLSFVFAWIFNDYNILLPLQVTALSIPAAYVLIVIKSYLQGKEKIGFLSSVGTAEAAVNLPTAASCGASN